ncbi:programmed cell death 6-interacting isoform X2 [Sigmodon hispidus]
MLLGKPHPPASLHLLCFQQAVSPLLLLLLPPTGGGAISPAPQQTPGSAPPPQAQGPPNPTYPRYPGYCQMPMPMDYSPYTYGQYNMTYTPVYHQIPRQAPYPGPQQPTYPFPQNHQQLPAGQIRGTGQQVSLVL